jgi:hypothetical protein
MAVRSVLDDIIAGGRRQSRNPLPMPALPLAAAPRMIGQVSPYAGPNDGNRIYRPDPYAAPVPSASLRYNPAAPLSITTTPKSASQNEFLAAMKGETRALIPQKQNARAKFVSEAYAQQGGNKAALDQETKFLDSIFKADGGGLVDELANARANRRAGVMMRTKMAMDRANRVNKQRRMMSGRSSYNDRLYGNALAGIGAEEAITAADRESEDLRYITGLRSGSLGRRADLGRGYLDSLNYPMAGVNASMRDDLSTLDSLARQDAQNSVYETPLDQIQREIAMRQRMDELDRWS